MKNHSTSLGMVTEFHETFNHPIAETPCIPSDEIIAFRNNFIKEELQELLKAVLEKNIVDFADAICDIQYVLDGLILNSGLQDKFHFLMTEVHASNMSKTCSTVEEAEATILKAQEENGECYYQQVGEFYIVYRRSDGKVMKSVNYFKPDLSRIIKF